MWRSTCEPGENCPDDSTGCVDTMCNEPTCSNGCGETPVVEGGTDESCFGSNGCAAGINCECNGAGECISDCRLSNVVIENDCDVDGCIEGEAVRITYTIDGNCGEGNHIQVDAEDLSGNCKISFSGEDISGVWKNGLNLNSYQYRIRMDGDAIDCWATQGSNIKCGELFDTQSECEAYSTCTIFEPPECRRIGKPSPKDWAEFDRTCIRVGGAPGRQTTLWTVPSVPTQCEGVSVSATNARIWKGNPCTIAISNAVTATGGFTFTDPDPAPACSDKSGWVTKTTNHGTWGCNEPIKSGCVRNDDSDDYYDRHCDEDKKERVIDYWVDKELKACITLGDEDHCCGDDDSVCPMEYEDRFGTRIGCGGFPDPDCCGGENTRWRECVRTVLKPDRSGEFIYPTCVTSTYDSSCCPNPTDCVYDGVCYEEFTIKEIYPNDKQEFCHQGKWCPEGMIYNSFQLRCEAEERVCHPDPPGDCRYLPFTELWYEDPDCYFPLGMSYPKEKSCCFDFSLGGQDFYNLKDVRIE